MFPNGWPGRGLLILRIGVGLLLLHDGICVMMAPMHQPVDGLSLASALAGLLLLVGLWTPIAGATLACLAIALFLVQGKDPYLLLLEAIIGIALALLGPGVRSIDAALFGRRRIDLPED
jgi:uncharacterized membrane protein YphA (DoxX/SURF4 family)